MKTIPQNTERLARIAKYIRETYAVLANGCWDWRDNRNDCEAWHLLMRMIRLAQLSTEKK